MLLNRSTRKRPASRRAPYVCEVQDAKVRRDRLDNLFGMWLMTKPLPPRDVTRRLKKLRLLPTRSNCLGCGSRLSKTYSLAQRRFRREAATMLEQELSSNISASTSWPSSIHSGQPGTTSGDAIISHFGPSQPQQARGHPHANGSSARRNREVAKQLREYLRPVVYDLAFLLGSLLLFCFFFVSLFVWAGEV